MDSSSYRLQLVYLKRTEPHEALHLYSLCSQLGLARGPEFCRASSLKLWPVEACSAAAAAAVVHSLLVLNTVLKLQRWRLVAVRWRGVSRAELTRRSCFWHIQTYFTQTDPVHRPLQGPGRVWGLIPEVQPHSGDTVSSPKVHWLWMVVPVHKASILDTCDAV